MNRLHNFVALLRDQLWVIPALMSGAALALAGVTLAVRYSPPRGSGWWWLHSGDAGTARDLLSALLSGMLTMTSLVVSMTFVVITLASSQLGPRLVWNFIGDRQIQAVLGLFVGTILYVLLVFRSLDGTLGEAGVPHVAITTGSALTVLCLAALLFYVDKIARSIVADTVVRRVAGDLRASIRDLPPRDRTDAVQSCRLPDLPPPAGAVSLARSGYVQTIDYAALVEIARQNGNVLRVDVRAGHFVLTRGRHVAVLARDGAVEPDGAIARAIRAAVVIGAERSPAQDLEYSVLQLVEVGVRALSAGINDPFTAMVVVDRLGEALEDMLGRKLPPTAFRDEAGEVRVIANRSEIGGLVDAAFDQIRQAALSHPAVLIHMADTLGKLSPILAAGELAEARDAVRRQLARLVETVNEAPWAPSDRATTLARIEQAVAAQPST